LDVECSKPKAENPAFHSTRLKLLSAALSITALVVTGACERYREAPLSASTEAARFRSRSLNGAGNELGSHSGGWDCASLTRAALSLNPELEVARAQLRTAQAAILTAGARPNPTLNLTAQNTSRLLQGMQPWTLGLAFDLPIETAGKRKDRIAQATAVSRAAALEAGATECQIRGRVRKNLVTLYAATTRGELLTGEQQTQEKMLKALDEQVAAGEIGRPEVIQSRLLYNQSQLLLRDAERQKGEARASLADAVGVPASALESVTLDLAEFSRQPPSVSASALRRRAMLSRPDVLAALAQYSASEAALRLEIAKQYPDFHFNPGYLYDQGQDKWFVTPTVELPIFDQHQGPIAEAKAKRDEAAARFRATQAKASGELDLALAGFHGALQKLETAEALLTSQEKQKQTAKALFENGESDRLAWSTAEVEYDTSAIARLDALVEVQQAFGALEDAACTTITEKK
jgi:outer membrane protein TolC